MTKYLFLFLLFALPLRAQNLYSLDSVEAVNGTDTISYSTVRIGRTFPLTAFYFHRGTSSLRMVTHDLSIGGDFYAISIPTVANGTYIGTVDSGYSGVLPTTTAAGDTLHSNI